MVEAILRRLHLLAHQLGFTSILCIAFNDCFSVVFQENRQAGPGVIKAVQRLLRGDAALGQLRSPPLDLPQALIPEGPKCRRGCRVPLAMTFGEELFQPGQIAAEGCQLPVPRGGPRVGVVQESIGVRYDIIECVEFGSCVCTPWRV